MPSARPSARPAILVAGGPDTGPWMEAELKARYAVDYDIVVWASEPCTGGADMRVRVRRH